MATLDCPLCAYNGARSDALLRHIKLIHKRDPQPVQRYAKWRSIKDPLLCKLCIHITSPAGMRLHLEACHPDEIQSYWHALSGRNAVAECRQLAGVFLEQLKQHVEHPEALPEQPGHPLPNILHKLAAEAIVEFATTGSGATGSSEPTGPNAATDSSEAVAGPNAATDSSEAKPAAHAMPSMVTRRAAPAARKRALSPEIVSRLNAGDSSAIIIQPAGGKGLGAFASMPLAQGAFVSEYGGELLTAVQADLREQECSELGIDPWYLFDFEMYGTQYCIDATQDTCAGRYLNHSRTMANCVPRSIALPTHNVHRPALYFITKTFVNAGEELLFDYGRTDADTNARFPWLTK